VVRILSALGVPLRDGGLGGNIYRWASGGRGAWRIGVQNPDETRGATLGVVR